MCEVGTRGARGLSVGRRRSGSVAPWRRAFTAPPALERGRRGGMRGGLARRGSAAECGRGPRSHAQAGACSAPAQGTGRRLGRARSGTLGRASPLGRASWSAPELLLGLSYFARVTARWKGFAGAGFAGPGGSPAQAKIVTPTFADYLVTMVTSRGGVVRPSGTRAGHGWGQAGRSGQGGGNARPPETSRPPRGSRGVATS